MRAFSFLMVHVQCVSDEEMEQARTRIDAMFFCRQPGGGTTVDEMYAAEERAALDAGLVVRLIDHDAAVAGDFSKAVRGVDTNGGGRRYVYRGWMLSSQMYRGLVGALMQRGWDAVTSPQDYEACHHLVGWADKLGSLTPRSAWIPHTPPFTHQELSDLLKSFEGPVIVKDYVKSEKHAWTQACFIPDARDLDQALGVINRFVELRDRDFAGGLVLRNFVRLKPIGKDDRSGMPLSRELRSFWMGTTCIAVSDYWRYDAAGTLPKVAEDAARLIDRPFFTIDVAMTDGGEWMVIEVGDGQVSALPDSLDASSLYAGLVGR